MSTVRGLATGALGLTLMQAVLSSETAINNTGTVITLATGALRRLVDPAVPLIPDRRSAVESGGGTVIHLAN